jgi:hypothetical protein
VFLVNSRYPLLSATSERSRSKSLHVSRHTFSRSYGVNLPSSLTRVLSSALACSAHLPESVYGTVTRTTPYEAFLGSMGSSTLRALRLSTSPLGVWNGSADLPTPPAYELVPGHPAPGSTTLLRPPFGQTFLWWYGNINPFPITYGSRPRLRDRLTLRRLTLLRNP